MTGSRPFRGAALLLGGALFLWTGCAASPGHPPAAVLASRGGDVVIPGVPFLPQEEESCGPSSLAMVLRFLGVDVDTAVLIRETRTAGLRGTLITDLAAAARRRGVEADVASLDLEGLRAEVARGVPAVLLVDLGFWAVSRPHFLVAYGFTGEGILAHTGRDAGKVIGYKILDARWAKTGRLALVFRRGGR